MLAGVRAVGFLLFARYKLAGLLDRGWSLERAASLLAPFGTGKIMLVVFHFLSLKVIEQGVPVVGYA